MQIVEQQVRAPPTAKGARQISAQLGYDQSAFRGAVSCCSAVSSLTDINHWRFENWFSVAVEINHPRITSDGR